MSLQNECEFWFEVADAAWRLGDLEGEREALRIAYLVEAILCQVYLEGEEPEVV